MPIPKVNGKKNKHGNASISKVLDKTKTFTYMFKQACFESMVKVVVSSAIHILSDSPNFTLQAGPEHGQAGQTMA